MFFPPATADTACSLREVVYHKRNSNPNSLEGVDVSESGEVAISAASSKPASSDATFAAVQDDLDDLWGNRASELCKSARKRKKEIQDS